LRFIRDAFPAHDILAEESADTSHGSAAPTSDWIWVVDPLDGTTNFLHQFPMYCSSVALLHKGVPVAGSVVCSATNEEWTASLGCGVLRNGEPARVSETHDLRRALVGTGFPFKLREVMPRYLKQFEHIIYQVSDVRRCGAAALDLCYVASGFLDGFWELDLRPWDYAAGVLMIREAGGVATGLDGEPVWTSGGGGIIAGNAHVYPHLVRSLEEVTE
jgi:myo-inositol-1(or 4)-monophosphatase